MIRDMARVMRDIKMETFMKGSFKITKHMVGVYISGRRGKFMMENGLKVRSRVMACGEASMVTAILENGKIA